MGTWGILWNWKWVYAKNVLRHKGKAGGWALPNDNWGKLGKLQVWLLPSLDSLYFKKKQNRKCCCLWPFLISALSSNLFSRNEYEYWNVKSRSYYQFNLPTSLSAQLDDSLAFINTWSPCWLAVHIVPMDATSSSISGYIMHQDWSGVTSQLPVTLSCPSLQQIKTSKTF